MTILTPDICIIGGGSGGLSVAAGAAQMGARVVLFEGGKMGAIASIMVACRPKPCLPQAKPLITPKVMPRWALPIKIQIDFSAVKDHVSNVIKGIEPHDSPERFRSLGVNVIEDYATFTGRGEIFGGGITVRPKYTVIATGSSAFVPPIPGLETYALLPYE